MAEDVPPYIPAFQKILGGLKENTGGIFFGGGGNHFTHVNEVLRHLGADAVFAELGKSQSFAVGNLWNLKIPTLIHKGQNFESHELTDGVDRLPFEVTYNVIWGPPTVSVNNYISPPTVIVN